MRDFLPPHRRLLFVQTAASILHHIEENKVCVGLHIALGLPVERWWSCTPPGSGKSGPTVEEWCRVPRPDQGSLE